jgi:integrase
MPKLVHRTPKYRRHRASGQAIITINGRDIYLGRHGTAVSRREYDRVVAEWLANGRRTPFDAAQGTSVVELIAAYWLRAQSYYAGTETGGDSNGELSCLRLALRVVKSLCGDTAVTQFGPLALKAVRQEMVKLGWARSHINPQVGRIRRMFRWGVENEMVPPSILHGLQAVAGLHRGKTEAPEREPVRPVPEAMVYAIKDHVARQVWAMIQLQLLTGMRPGEVSRIRSGDIDTSGRLWVYSPTGSRSRPTTGGSGSTAR